MTGQASLTQHGGAAPPAYGTTAALKTFSPAEKVTDAEPGQSWFGSFMAVVAPAIYIALYCAFDIFAAKSAKDHGGYYSFFPACMVFTIEFGKLVVSLVLILCSRPEMPNKARIVTTASGFIPVAACFAVGNILMLVCLAKVSLANYGVWYQTSIFFNAFLFYIAFRRPFGIQRIIAMSILVVGCVINSIHPGMKLHVDSAVLWVVLSAFVAALGCVMNEYFMKRDFAMDINIQNSILYSETCISCLLIIAFLHPAKLVSPFAFFHGFHGDCWVIAGLSIFIGLSVSRILKYAGVMTKTFATAIHCPIEMIAAHYVIDLKITSFTVVSALIIGVAIGMYSTAPKYDAPAKLMGKDDSHA